MPNFEHDLSADHIRKTPRTWLGMKGFDNHIYFKLHRRTTR